MDVHHHSHTDRKKFKHYFFEFFMLFLAVFSGFIAEYFLENIIERHREKEFIESMFLDLKEDTAKINQVYEINKKQLLGIDTLLNILYNFSTNKDSVQKAYRLYYHYSLNYDNVVFTDRTMTQLKNSGGLRLIRNQNVSDSIMNYDAGTKLCETQFNVVKTTWESESNFSYSIFDLKDLYTYRNDAHLLPQKLLSSETATLRAYTSRLKMFWAVVAGYEAAIREQKQTAIRLIDYLRKQYHLEVDSTRHDVL